MKPSFQLTEANTLKSAMVPASTASPLLGKRVCVARAVDWAPHATFKKGERGIIDSVCPETGAVDVLLDTFHPGLARWDNHVTVEPYGSEDIEDALRVVPHYVRPWVMKAGRHIAPRVLLSCFAFVCWTYFVHDGHLLADPEDVETFGVMLTGGALSGLAAFLFHT